MIANEEAATNRVIQETWRRNDQARRQRTLEQNWPNRAFYEEQMRGIRNINSGQGNVEIEKIRTNTKNWFIS